MVRVLFSEELRRCSLRISLMRFASAVLCFAILSSAGQTSAQQPVPDSSTATSNSPAQAQPLIDVKPDASGVVPAEQIRALLLRAEENDIQNDKRQRDYTYVERVEQHKLDDHGAIKSTETRTLEILQIYGEEVERLTAKDDKPLSAGDAKKEDDKIQKIIDKRKGESEDARRKRLQREEKDREEDRKFVLEVSDAFNFKLVGSETLNGRDAWVVEGEPRPGFEPKSREAHILTKFHGRIWIDKADAQWVKLDITAIDTISIGFVLARIHKGTHLVIELTRVNDEVWLPQRAQFHFDARVALFKGYNEDVDQTYRDYKKFGSNTKITVIGEQQ